MSTITAQMVKELREATGAGVLDCKEALVLHEGDLEKAVAHLREKGMAAAAKRAEREAKEGLIGSYIHAGSKVAALVELNCETDFVARTEQFQELAHDLAMQVVAAKPLYMTKESVPAEALDEERAKYQAEVQGSGKPEHVIQQIVEGKLAKFHEENCLFEQPFIKDPSITIGELVQQKNALLGENLVVRRFVRFKVGG
ncbi:MAG: translation elongation factor Ts [Anaerolineae bacterium]|nr:translation elongation factor Ts [Anaerolineae bacterium]